MVVPLDPYATESRTLSFAPEFLTRHRLSGRSDRRKAKRARPTLGRWTNPTLRTLQGAREVGVAVTCKLWDTLVVNSHVTFRTANDTRFIVSEAETRGKVNQPSRKRRRHNLSMDQARNPSTQRDHTLCIPCSRTHVGCATTACVSAPRDWATRHGYFLGVSTSRRSVSSGSNRSRRKTKIQNIVDNFAKEMTVSTRYY